MNLDIPKVMGILNVTPDSFYSGSRVFYKEDIEQKVARMIHEGAEIIDVGGCSTRPGFEAPSIEEEWERVDLGCSIVREIDKSIPLSVDTFRSSIAKKVIEKWDVDIINDVSGGMDPDMFETIASSGTIYVLTHNRGINTKYDDVTAEVITDLSKKINELHRLGVNDIIIDPGFGFSKTIEENFILFEELDEIVKIGLPILIGISRKSMIYKTLECSPDEALNGTIALDSIALEKGAKILRVHDVRPAVETVRLFKQLKKLSL